MRRQELIDRSLTHDSDLKLDKAFPAQGNVALIKPSCISDYVVSNIPCL